MEELDSMSNETYISGRKKYQRPQAILFADNSGTQTDGKWTPNGEEFANFIILTDDNRQYIDLSYDRIEKRERMINGRMRSYHVADKLKLSVNWDMIPSRAFDDTPTFNPITGALVDASAIESYTTDRGAGGADMKDWYDANVGSFWVYLSYDDPNQSGYDKMGVAYNEPVEMYFSNFAYTVQRRGGTTFDLWNVQMSLEEV